MSGTVRFPYSESELLAGITPDNAHVDELADPKETEVGLGVERTGYIEKP